MSMEEAIIFMEEAEADFKADSKAYKETKVFCLKIASHYRLAVEALKEKQERESKVEQSQDYSFEVGV